MRFINKLKSAFSLVKLHPRAAELVFVPCFLLLVFWIFLGRFLQGEHSIAAFQDNTYLILPIFSFISKSFSSGEFPYWIKSIVGGIPLYTTPQFSAIYPFYFFRFELYRSPVEALSQLHYVVLFHVAIAYINTYVMLRIFGLPIVPSILGATLFAFSANIYDSLHWINIIAPYSWLPLALGSVYLVLENKRPKLGLLLGTLSFGLLIMASPAQAFIHLLYCTGVLSLTYLIVNRKDRVKQIAPIRGLILLGVMSLVVSAAVLVPVLVSAPKMIRFMGDFPPVVGNARVPFRASLVGQFEPRELANVLFPLRMDQVVGDSYLGVLPVFLALFSGFRARRHWIIMPFLVLGLYTLLSSTGEHLGLAYVNYLLPLWNKIREPGRHLILFALMFSTLSAFGFHHLTEWIKKGSDLELRKHAVVCSLFVLLFLACYVVRQGYETRVADSVLIGSFVGFVIILTAFRFSHQKYGGKGVRELLLGAVVVYPQLYFPASIPLVKDNDYFTAANLRSHRILKEISKIPDVYNYRIIFEDDQLNIQYWSMNAIYYGLRTFAAYMNPLPHKQFVEMYFAAGRPNYSKLLGAKYHVCHACSPNQLSDYVLEREIEGYKLYSTDKARPRYFVTSKIAQTYDDREGFFSKVEAGDDYLKKAFVRSKDAGVVAAWLDSRMADTGYEIIDERFSQNSLKLILKTKSRALLVLNEYFNEDWEVRVDGRLRKPLRVNLNQIGVLVPRGTAQVHFEYRPRLFRWLVFLHWAVLVGLAVYACVVAFRTRRGVKQWLREQPPLRE